MLAKLTGFFKMYTSTITEFGGRGGVVGGGGGGGAEWANSHLTEYFREHLRTVFSVV